MSTLLRGMVVAGVLALAIVLSTLLALPSPWPVLLVVAVASARTVRPGTVGAVLVGAVAWWIAMAMRAGFLPDTVSSRVLAAVVAVALCTGAAAASRERLPLWAGLGGAALFAATYEPIYAQAPTGFVADSVLAFGSVVVALGLGVLAAVVAELLAGRAAGADQFVVLSSTEGVV